MMQIQDSKAKLVTYSIVKIYERKDVLLRTVGILFSYSIFLSVT